MTSKIQYKQIVVSHIEHNVCLFHMVESNLRNEELFIIGLAQFIEFAEYIKPTYVIFDRTSLNYKVPDILIGHFKKFGIDIFYKLGVKSIFLIADANHELNADLKKEISTFTSIEDCLAFIKKQKNIMLESL
ncbi:MAG: hypothetical protein AB7S48_13810 [Bacteroidales bacterium]